jgi:hypothetical protein
MTTTDDKDHLPPLSFDSIVDRAIGALPELPVQLGPFAFAFVADLPRDELLVLAAEGLGVALAEAARSGATAQGPVQ